MPGRREIEHWYPRDEPEGQDWVASLVEASVAPGARGGGLAAADLGGGGLAEAVQDVQLVPTVPMATVSDACRNPPRSEAAVVALRMMLPERLHATVSAMEWAVFVLVKVRLFGHVPVAPRLPWLAVTSASRLSGYDTCSV